MARTTRTVTPNQTADKSIAGFVGALVTGLSAALVNGGDIGTSEGLISIGLAVVTAAIVYLKNNYLTT